MKNFDSIKNRVDINSARPLIINEFKGSKTINVIYDNEIHILDYIFFDNNHYIVIPKRFTETNFFGLICEDQSRSKLYKQIRVNFSIEKTDVDVEDRTISKKIKNKYTLNKMVFDEAYVVLSYQEIFTVDYNMNPTFASLDLSKNKRYENSRYVCMSYLEKEFVLNVIVENNEYYSLTTIDSNKVKHIKNSNNFICYDGLGVEFKTSIEILDDSYVDIVFNKLDSTNNNYFKNKDNLIAIKFCYNK